MGWFDDNHWAGEAYNYGMGYMARSGYSGPCASLRAARCVHLARRTIAQRTARKRTKRRHAS